MPIAFIVIGALFLSAAVQGTVSDSKPGAGDGLVSLLKSDFIGPQSFLIWIAALWILGALGYIPGFKPIANALLVLVLVVLVIVDDRNTSGGNGFIANLQSAIRGTGSTTKTGFTSAIGNQVNPVNSIPSLPAQPTGLASLQGLI